MILTSGSMSCPGPVQALGIAWKYKYDAPSPQTDRRTIIQYTPAMGSPGPLTEFTLKGLPTEGACQSQQRVPAVLHLMSKVTAALALLGWGPQVPTLSHGSGSRGGRGVTQSHYSLQEWT